MQSAGGVLKPPPLDLGGGEQPGELIPAEPGDRVVPGEGGEPLGDVDQHLVAGGVSVPIVDLFEVVEIEDGGDQRPSVRPGQQGGGKPMKGSSVGQAGEWVVQSWQLHRPAVQLPGRDEGARGADAGGDRQRIRHESSSHADAPALPTVTDPASALVVAQMSVTYGKRIDTTPVGYHARCPMQMQ